MGTEDNKSLEHITSISWELFNIIRGPISASEYYIFLYLLSLYNEGGDLEIFIDENNNAKFAEPKHDINSKGISSDTNKVSQINSFNEFFKPSLAKLMTLALSDIQRLFNSLDRNVLKRHFPYIFDFFLFEILKLQGKVAGEFSQPKELTNLICALADLKANAKVYNPFAGYASFGISLPDSILYLGQEINYATWVIGSLRILAHNKQGHCHYVHENSIEQWGMVLEPPLDLSDKFEGDAFKHDLIVANPPFGMRLASACEGKFGSIKTAEHFLIEKGIDELRPEGKLIAILPQGLLFRSGSEQNLRQYLIENDLVEMIVSLPSGLLMHTMIPTIILVINKQKENKLKGVVRYVEAHNFVNKSSGKEKILAVAELLEVIKSNNFSDSVRYISNETIRNSDYNLSVPRYFQNTIEGIELRELITSVRGLKNYNPSIGKIIRIKDLKEDKFNYKLEVDTIDDLEIPTFELKVSESCLLVASVGGKLKPTYFPYTGTPIYINSDILTFKVDEKKVDLDYLISELQTDQSIEQISSFYIGTTMPKLRREDFLSVKIPLPSIAEQKAKIKGLKQEHIRSKEREIILEREILGLKDEAFREFASIKHTFRQYLNALKSNVSGTRKFISKNENHSISLDTIYSHNLNQTLGDHLLSLENTIDSMSRLLNVPDEQPSDQFIKSSGKQLELDVLVLNAQNRFKNPEVFSFEKLFIDKESFAYPDGFYAGPLTYILADDFYRIFSNIITNAVEHGFRNRTNNIIRTSISFDHKTTSVILEVSNNGNPLPKGFTIKHLTTRGEKTSDSYGAGIGGADIKGLLDKYGASLDIKSNENDDFPVTYILKFDAAIYTF